MTYCNWQSLISNSILRSVLFHNCLLMISNIFLSKVLPLFLLYWIWNTLTLPKSSVVVLSQTLVDIFYTKLYILLPWTCNASSYNMQLMSLFYLIQLKTINITFYHLHTYIINDHNLYNSLILMQVLQNKTRWVTFSSCLTELTLHTHSDKDLSHPVIFCKQVFFANTHKFSCLVNLMKNGYTRCAEIWSLWYIFF